MKRSLLAFAALLLGCPAGPGDDYYLLEVGNVWEYALLGGEATDVWTLALADAADNPNDERGDIYVRLFRLEEDQLRPGETIEVNQRAFNIRSEEDNTGSEPVPQGWTYRFANEEEGVRNEFFLPQPGNDGWTDPWEYEFESSNTTDWSHSVVCTQGTDRVETAYGNYDDTVNVVRQVQKRTVDALSGDTQTLTWTHEEFWALDAGLVRYRLTSSQGQTFDLALRNASAFDL
jgi:hypothetical protein